MALRRHAKLGVAQSALSHTVRELEGRLGVRLLTRTTAARHRPRLVSGFWSTDPDTTGISRPDRWSGALGEFCDQPAGTIRITATDYVADTVLWPRLVKFLQTCPDIKVEIVVDYGFTDIVAERFDAGVRRRTIAKDMIAVRIGPDLRMAVVGAPSYLKQDRPVKPQDLVNHVCINLRHADVRWALCLGVPEGESRDQGSGRGPGRIQRHPSDASTRHCPASALPMCRKPLAKPYVAKGQLVRVLEDWCPPIRGCTFTIPAEETGIAGLQPAGGCIAISRSMTGTAIDRLSI